MPNFKFKLPSRNWLIFWAITGTFTSSLLYDRYEKKKAQRKWCNFVSILKEEPLPSTAMPRKVTIFLSAPPGDSLRPARDHFHEYIKPILVAGGLDWEVIEGRKEGDVRAGLAKKIRRLRKRNGETSPSEASDSDVDEATTDDLFYEVRKRSGVTEWDGVQGDLVLGRHTWQEYIRGLHEGWLGPLDPPRATEPTETNLEPSQPPPSDSPSSEPLSGESASDSNPKPDSPTPDPSPKKPAKASPPPPYILPRDYPACPTPPFPSGSIEPSLPLPLPHLLGILNTPTRVYRFLTRRYLADSTGRSVAALVLASQVRPYTRSANFASAIDSDEAFSKPLVSSEGAIMQNNEPWEQEIVLAQERREWHKSAFKVNEPGETTERPWQEPMAIDSRIGQRMSQFELEDGADEEALKVDAAKRVKEPAFIERIRKWTGFEKQGKKGWDMGLEGEENE